MEDKREVSTGINAEKNQFVTANKSIKHVEYNCSSDEVDLQLEKGSDYLEDVIRGLAQIHVNTYLKEKIRELEFDIQRIQKVVSSLRVQISFHKPFASFDASHAEGIHVQEVDVLTQGLFSPDAVDGRLCTNINTDKVESSENIDTQKVKRQEKKPMYSSFEEGRCSKKYVTCKEDIETSVIRISRIYMSRLQNQHDECVQVLQIFKTNVEHETQFTRRFVINYFLEKRREKNGLFIRTNVVIQEFRNQTKDLWTILSFKRTNLFIKQYVKTEEKNVLRYIDEKSWLKEFFKRSNHIRLKPCTARDKKVRAQSEIKVFGTCSTHKVQGKKNKVTPVPEEALENTKELLRTFWSLSCSQKVTSLGSQIKCLCKYMCCHHRKECHDKDNKDDHFQSIIEFGPIPYQSISVLPVTMRVGENELVEGPDRGIVEQSVPNIPGQLGLFGVESRPELNDGNENEEAQVRTEHDVISIHGNSSSLPSTASSLSYFVRLLTNPAVCSSTREEINQETEPTQIQNTVRKEIESSNCQPVPCTDDIEQREQPANPGCHSARNAQNPSLTSMSRSENARCNSVENTPSPLLGAVGGFEESQGRSTILHSVRGRVKTFNAGWTHISPSPRQLAEAGFYYCGPNDRTRCICCGIHLEEWKTDDDPLVEHLRFSSECRFANSKIESLDSSLNQTQNISELQFVATSYSGIQESCFTSIQETHYSTVTEGWQHSQDETVQDDFGEINSDDDED